ncbi:MAG TPA: MarR family transcriptional regulator [Longimicrobiales bacterium]
MDQGAREFIERLGIVAEEQGIPRIGARMLGFLLLQEEPKCLDRLAEALQVSKASVSINARWLEQCGLVERVSSPGDRRDYYRIGEEPWERIYGRARQRMQRMHDVLAAGCEMLAPDAEVGRRRLAEWQRFHAFMLEEFETRVERWREYRARGEAGAGGSPEADSGEGGARG